MDRRDVSLRLHKTLLVRRAHLCATLAGQLASLRDFKAADCTGDSADMAFETSCDALSSQLAELDARRLDQIEGALGRLQQGTYRICEGCQKRIPAARLKALPDTAFCIHCEQEMDKQLNWQDPATRNWDQVFDSQTPMDDRRVDLAELELSLFGNPRGLEAASADAGWRQNTF